MAAKPRRRQGAVEAWGIQAVNAMHSSGPPGVTLVARYCFEVAPPGDGGASAGSAAGSLPVTGISSKVSASF